MLQGDGDRGWWGWGVRWKVGRVASPYSLFSASAPSVGAASAAREEVPEAFAETLPDAAETEPDAETEAASGVPVA